MSTGEEVAALEVNWFTDLVQTFVAASHDAVTKLGWEELFKKYDDDGSVRF